MFDHKVFLSILWMISLQFQRTVDLGCLLEFCIRQWWLILNYTQSSLVNHGGQVCLNDIKWKGYTILKMNTNILVVIDEIYFLSFFKKKRVHYIMKMGHVICTGDTTRLVWIERSLVTKRDWEVELLVLRKMMLLLSFNPCFGLVLFLWS